MSSAATLVEKGCSFSVPSAFCRCCKTVLMPSSWGMFKYRDLTSIVHRQTLSGSFSFSSMLIRDLESLR